MDYNSFRRKSKEITIGNVKIGGKNPIAVQSMTNTDTHDIRSTLDQVRRLSEAGCSIVRIAYPDSDCFQTIRSVKESCPDVAIVADIHFDYRLAIDAVRAGADKIRINPGNIGSEEKIGEVVKACKNGNIPIRVGVNSGSLQKELLEKYGGPTPEALAESALLNVKAIERFDYDNIVVSVKSSDVRKMVISARILSEKTGYPIHIGVTEAGTPSKGRIKSFVGIGSLLCDGIGDTIRISLTGDPVSEVESAKELLASLGIFESCGFEIVSCPTCGRTKIDLIPLAETIERELKKISPKKNLKIALMGCAVNGPGEARDADIGIAGGNGEAILFCKGKIIKKIEEKSLIPVFLEEVRKLNG